MKKTTSIVLCALLAMFAGLAFAGQIPSLKTPTEIRDLILDSMQEWVNKADTTTGCAGGDCCIAFANAACLGAGNPWPCCTGVAAGFCSNPNTSCTAAGAPAACCTGALTGTCEDVACLAFAEVVRLDFVGWADDVETQLKFDGDWLCDDFPNTSASNRMDTVCTTVSGSPIIDVSRILTEIAVRRHSPIP